MDGACTVGRFRFREELNSRNSSSNFASKQDGRIIWDFRNHVHEDLAGTFCAFVSLLKGADHTGKGFPGWFVMARKGYRAGLTGLTGRA
jgi:hypothetical protein